MQEAQVSRKYEIQAFAQDPARESRLWEATAELLGVER